MISQYFLDIANKFLIGENSIRGLPKPYYYKIDSDPKDLISDWYFDFIIDRTDNGHIESFAGAPGFKISKATKKVEIISFSELSILKASKALTYKFLKIATASEFDGFKLISLKDHFNIPTPELVKLRNYLNSLNWNDDKSLENAHQILKEVMR